MESIFMLIFLINALGWAIRGYPTASALASVAVAICVLAHSIANKDLSDINKHRMW